MMKIFWGIISILSVSCYAGIAKKSSETNDPIQLNLKLTNHSKIYQAAQKKALGKHLIVKMACHINDKETICNTIEIDSIKK